MKVPFPRRIKAWLVAAVSLIAVTVVSVAPMIRPRAQSSTTYTFTDLGTLGGTYSKAYGINNCGLIVGEFAPSGTSPLHPFLWRDSNGNLISDPGEMKDLGTLGGVRGTASDINASGLVVGTSTIAVGEERAFRWFDADGDGVSDPGEMNDLGVLPDYSTFSGWGVNDNGQIVGSAEKNTLETSAFVWNASTGFQILATQNGIAPSHGYAINNSSHIAGYAQNTDHAFVFNGTTNVDLGTFGGSRSIAYDINASGHAVGFAHVNGGGDPFRHAFKWNPALPIPLQDLGVLTGGDRSQAHSINSSGIVVGYSEVTGGARHAFVHDGTQMSDLNTLTTLPAGWTLVEARGINDSGQIVGFGTTSGGETHAFLLTPTNFTSSCSPTVTVTVLPAFVSEDGATNLTYTFTRAPVTNAALTVNFSTTGTADSSDYGISSSGSVMIPANQPSATVVVDPAVDGSVEGDETVALTITPPSPGTSYTIGSPALATGTINNDDSLPNVSVAVAPPATAEDGVTNLVYTFTRSGPVTNSLTVNFSVGGSAGFGTDYGQTGAVSFTTSAGSVSFGVGHATATVTVHPTTDTTDEPDETVILTITPDGAYTIAAAPQNAATGTITDDDPTPTIQITNVTAAEPPSGSVTFAFTVSLSNPSSTQVTVNYATDTTGATATGGANCGGGVDFFNIPSTELPFSAGETSKLVHVTVCTDSDLEPDETFFVNLSGNSANSVLPANTKGTGTITPQAPIVFTEEGNGTFAAAVDSVTFARGPFRLVNNLNFSEDRLTRVILFTSPLGMTDANLASGILSVHINGYANPLPIEHVGPIGVTGLSASYIIVKLPAELSTLNPSPGPNHLTLTVKMGSASSNVTLLGITP